MPGPDLRGMPILLAARLSKKKKEDNQTGLESQDSEFRRVVEAQGATVIHVAPDHKSGTSAMWARKNLKPWVTDPKLMRLYSAVGAYKLDRLSRGNSESTAAIEEWARRNGKWLITADGLYFPCEGNEGIRWDVTKRIAHEEWLAASERYKRMHRTLAEGGFFTYGRVPFGYRLVKVPGSEHKTLEPDPATAPFVKEAVVRYLAGDSIRAVCAWLDVMGVKPWFAERWSPNSVRKIFHNPAIMGRLCNAKGATLLRVEPIIMPETWHKLQKEMAMRHTGAVPTARRGSAQYSGLVECPSCGARMTSHVKQGTRVSGKTYRYEYYRCDGNSLVSRSACRNMVRAEQVDEAVNLHMTLSAHAEERVKEIAVIPGHGPQDEIAAIEEDLRALDMDDPGYLTKAAELHAERARLKGLPAEPDRIMERVTGLTVGEHWAALDAAGRRAFLLASKARIVADKAAVIVVTHEWVMADAPSLALA